MNWMKYSAQLVFSTSSNSRLSLSRRIVGIFVVAKALSIFLIQVICQACLSSLVMSEACSYGLPGALRVVSSSIGTIMNFYQILGICDRSISNGMSRSSSSWSLKIIMLALKIAFQPSYRNRKQLSLESFQLILTMMKQSQILRSFHMFSLEGWCCMTWVNRVIKQLELKQELLTLSSFK